MLVDKELLELIRVFSPSAIALIALWVGAKIKYQFDLIQAKYQRRLDLIERQIKEFYYPIMAIQKEVDAMHQLHSKIDAVSEQVWKNICEKEGSFEFDYDKAFEPFGKSIDYHNKQFTEQILPLYKKMFSIFSESSWLLDEDERKNLAEFHFELLKFNILWEMNLRNSISTEVTQGMELSIKKLRPFFDIFESTLEDRKKELFGRKSVFSRHFKTSSSHRQLHS